MRKLIATLLGALLLLTGCQAPTEGALPQSSPEETAEPVTLRIMTMDNAPDTRRTRSTSSWIC